MHSEGIDLFVWVVWHEKPGQQFDRLCGIFEFPSKASRYAEYQEDRFSMRTDEHYRVERWKLADLILIPEG